jgi:hypothetical protein
MIDELNKAIIEYRAKWQKLVDRRHDKEFFAELMPTAVGWKVTDQAEHDRLVAELRDRCDLVIGAYMNDRWITKLHLKDNEFEWGFTVVKVMERRPGSADPVGLDHIDFYSPAVAQADEVLKSEPGLTWEHETNGASWISVRFEGQEAKLRTDTVLDSYIRDLREARNQIIKCGL